MRTHRRNPIRPSNQAGLSVVFFISLSKKYDSSRDVFRFLDATCRWPEYIGIPFFVACVGKTALNQSTVLPGKKSILTPSGPAQQAETASVFLSTWCMHSVREFTPCRLIWGTLSPKWCIRVSQEYTSWWGLLLTAICKLEWKAFKSLNNVLAYTFLIEPGRLKSSCSSGGFIQCSRIDKLFLVVCLEVFAILQVVPNHRALGLFGLECHISGNHQQNWFWIIVFPNFRGSRHAFMYRIILRNCSPFVFTCSVTQSRIGRGSLSNPTPIFLSAIRDTPLAYHPTAAHRVDSRIAYGPDHYQ